MRSTWDKAKYKPGTQVLVKAVGHYRPMDYRLGVIVGTNNATYAEDIKYMLELRHCGLAAWFSEDQLIVIGAEPWTNTQTVFDPRLQQHVEAIDKYIQYTQKNWPHLPEKKYKEMENKILKEEKKILKYA